MYGGAARSTPPGKRFPSSGFQKPSMNARFPLDLIAGRVQGLRIMAMVGRR